MAAIVYLAILFILLSSRCLVLLGRKGCEVWVSILNLLFLEVFTIGFGILSGMK